jgi:hypothetical protein
MGLNRGLALTWIEQAAAFVGAGMMAGIEQTASAYSLSLARIKVPPEFIERYSGGTGPVRIILVCAGAWILSPR